MVGSLKLHFDPISFILTKLHFDPINKDKTPKIYTCTLQHVNNKYSSTVHRLQANCMGLMTYTCVFSPNSCCLLANLFGFVCDCWLIDALCNPTTQLHDIPIAIPLTFLRTTSNCRNTFFRQFTNHVSTSITQLPPLRKFCCLLIGRNTERFEGSEREDDLLFCVVD